jgi:heptosyltransferase-1
MNNYSHILIVKLSAIGDVIHALPVAHALKEAFPQARLTWVVEKAAYELVANHPAIDKVILFEKSRCRSWAGLINYVPGFVRQLKEERCDLALDLQGLLKSALIAWSSGAPKRLVYCNSREFSDRFSQKVCGPNQNGHIIEQYLDLVRALGGPVNRVDFGLHFTVQEAATTKQILQAHGWQGEPYVALVPGANWPNKRWTPELFGQLARRLYELGIRCSIVGGPGDCELAKVIGSNAAVPLFDLTAQTSLRQLALILKNARVTVGGDTGPMHLAVAVNTPTVALMGPTDIKRNGPYGSGHRPLTTNRDCAGCWRRRCEKGLDCLAAISVDKVFQAVRELFDKERS